MSTLRLAACFRLPTSPTPWKAKVRGWRWMARCRQVRYRSMPAAWAPTSSPSLAIAGCSDRRTRARCGLGRDHAPTDWLRWLAVGATRPSSRACIGRGRTRVGSSLAACRARACSALPGASAGWRCTSGSIGSSSVARAWHRRLRNSLAAADGIEVLTPADADGDHGRVPTSSLAGRRGIGRVATARVRHPWHCGRRRVTARIRGVVQHRGGAR